jgi:hypothetical protein
MIIVRLFGGTSERRERMSNGTDRLEDTMEDSSFMTPLYCRNWAPCKSWSNRKSSFHADFTSEPIHSHADLNAFQSCFKLMHLGDDSANRLRLPATPHVADHVLPSAYVDDGIGSVNESANHFTSD